MATKSSGTDVKATAKKPATKLLTKPEKIALSNGKTADAIKRIRREDEKRAESGRPAHARTR
jgi:hypothetical protein